MNSITPLLHFKPASIEHIDDILFNQTQGQRNFEPVRKLLDLDNTQYKSLLFVEFFEPPQDLIDEVLNLKLGANSLYCKDVQQRNMLWEFRKAGLSLLTGMKGARKPVTGVEDTAVRPEDLNLYVQELSEIMHRYGVQASFYGHASAGLLHVRPVLDLHEPADIKKFRKLAEEVFALVRKYRGTFTGEHGVGMAHSEFMKEQIGEDLFQLMVQIKHTFDPLSLMNPGKITDLSQFRFDENLRWRKLTLPFEPCLAFSSKDESFIGNLEQCNGCGACRKETPTMCPTFIARGEEILSTRGRANIIRHVIEESAHNPEILYSSELEQAIKYCLACRACTVECPSNVNMSLLKAELLHAINKKYIPRFTKFLLSNIDTLGKIASLTPLLANFSLKNMWLRNILEHFSGIIANRPLPLYAHESFHRWFYRTYNGWKTAKGTRGTVILWDDCFIRYHEPEIGKDAVKVLTSAGFQVEILPDKTCCGRPAFSVGNLNNARKKGEQNIKILKDRKEPILFLEPSCFTMFYEDYKELKLESAEMIIEKSMLLEEFLANLLENDSSALPFSHNKSMQIAVHTHCHTKATRGSIPMKDVLSHIPNAQVQILPSACCGMAGAYGIMKDTYELSMEVGEHLKELIEILPIDTKIIASGTSCRQQIS
ncbi:MAG: FAD-binding and (Fe-S)-binding domain-containing protein, partial [Candidatus Hydrogenedens sp.]